MHNETIQFFLGRIAADLSLAVTPGFLTRGQIATAAGFSNSHSLSSAASRGVTNGQARWLAFDAVVGRGAHRVAAERVAHWRAIEAEMLPMPSAPAPVPASPFPAAADSKRGPGRPRGSSKAAATTVHRCLGGG